MVMNESVEVRVARMEENMKFLIRETEQAERSRKVQYQALESLQRTMDGFVGTISGLSTDILSVKTSLASQAPTIEEFITIKHKVVGAAKFGKHIWAIGGLFVGFIMTNHEVIFTWLSKF